MKSKFQITKVFKQKLLMPLLVGCCILFAINGYSQGVSINATGIPADPSAMLDVSSTSKGLLIPRVALASINDVATITSPAISLLVYNTNAAMTGGAVGFWYFNGTNWVQAIGPQGPIGATGAVGAQGPVGPVGATGAVGVQGPIGPIGATGAQGLQGLVGPVGATGAVGAQGIPGPVGATGSVGAQGIPGPVGATGAAGAVGATGPAGPVGCATANMVIKSNGTSATCSQIFDNGTNVGIGTTSPGYKLQIDNFSIGNTQVKIGGGNVWSSGHDNVLYFGDGSYAYVGETYADDALTLYGSGGMRIAPYGNYGTSGQVLTSDGSYCWWQSIPSTWTITSDNFNTNGTLALVTSIPSTITSSNAAWITTGNSGTVDGTNFIGTTDNVPFNIKVNNQKAGRIDNILFNTFIGYQAANNNTTGSINTVNGYQALYSNTTGNGNTATGGYALYSNINGGYNTAHGEHALYSNQTGFQNTAIGVTSLRNNTSGNCNTATGDQTLLVNSSGSYNTANGWRALMLSTGSNNTATGNQALYDNSSGNYNTADGNYALNDNTTGSYNTALGNNAFAAGTSFDNSMALGSNAIIDASNKVRIGDASVTSAWVQVNWSIGSDVRIKNNVKENVSGLDFIKLLRPVTYNYNISKQNEILGVADTSDLESKYDIEKIQFSGFIAQEVDAAAKNAGYSFSGIDKSGKLWGLRYAEFTVPLVKAVQELDESLNVNVESLKLENQALKAQLSSLQKEIEEIKLKLGL